MTEHNPQVLSASSINGDSVKNPQGENLGHIEDLMVDLNSGNIAYAVLSFGGFLGVGDKLFAMPWPALKLDAEDKAFVLNISKEKLENAPGFDKDHWPDVTNRKWIDQVYQYYDYKPYR